MSRFLGGRQLWLYLACLILLIPAFFINLGKMPLFGDEPIRGLVALEMIFSDNWVAPTINGEFYFKKPPFYNWLVAGTIELLGKASEWVIRLPAIIPLLLYALTIYLVFKPYTGFKTAFLSAFFFITCGRILIYSSLLGHIDFFYAWLTFVSFMWIFYMYERQQWLALFSGSYAMAAVGFLCKGIPSVVFQGLTLIAWFTYQGQLKRLFYWQHFLGGLGFLVLIGIYALFYQQSGSLEALISTLWSQSSKRTILEQPLLSTIIHLMRYPFQMLYHILPWSLLVVFLFRRDWRQKIRENRLLSFSMVTLAGNIWVYWISPATLPRYIFMLYPFLFLFFAYFYQLSLEMGRFQKVRQVLEGFFGLAAVVLALSFWIPVFNPQLVHTSGILWKVSILFGLMVLLIGLFWKLKEHRIIIMILVLLMMRTAFSTFILPTRAVNSKYPLLRESAHQVVQITKGQPLHLLKPTPLSVEQSFYITRERESVLKTVAPDTLKHPQGYYIGSDSALRNLNYKQQCYFHTKDNNKKLYLFKISSPVNQQQFLNHNY